MDKFTEKCGEYGNHHEEFHIVQNGLTEEEIQKALEEILGEDGWAADGEVTEEGVTFSTAKEDIEWLTRNLSLKFPEAICFGQDSWDYEGYIVCMKNGKPCTDYYAEYTALSLDSDEKGYLEIEFKVSTENGYYFCAGGGLVYQDELLSFEKFRQAGTYDPEEDYK